MKIGVLGGTFDPPHTGHLALARAALEQLELDEVIFMPTHRNPIKGRSVVTPPKHRAGMVDALLQHASEPRFAYSDQEITRGGPSYTVDTMTEMQMARPGEYWFIMGTDSLKTLPEWKQPQRLMRLSRLAVAVRPPSSPHEVLSRVPEEFRAGIDVVQMTPVDVSSTDLRDRLTRHQSVNPWIPSEVLKYIHTHRLYQ
jgi:nicotinate-nucleotide adenylyltransferase